MKYTFANFKKSYPNDKACLLKVLDNRYGNTCPRCGVVGVKWHPITGRKGFVCSECDRHIYPLADTIFRKSETSLWNWFYAIYLFSVSKNGVSAKELERHLGCSYKTAWRMCKQIRLLMEQNTGKLGGNGPVEADEMEFGAPVPQHQRGAKHTMVFGAVERDGKAVAKITDWASTNRAMSFIRAHLESGSELYTDGSNIYRWTDKEFKHAAVNHSKRSYVRGNAHVNTIEGLWGVIQTSITGTYRGVSPKYLQMYLDEFIMRYNHRTEAIFPVLLERV